MRGARRRFAKFRETFAKLPLWVPLRGARRRFAKFRETFVMGALEGRYLAGPATWSPHLAGPATWNPQWDLTATARSPPAGLPSELSRRFERSERDADLPNTVYGRSAPARMSDAGQVPRSRNRKFRKAIKAFAQNTVQKRVQFVVF